MIKTCLQCGAVNGADAALCCFCDASLEPRAGEPRTREAPVSEPAVDELRVTAPRQGFSEPCHRQGTATPDRAAAHDYRREAFGRVQAYRSRRAGVIVQSDLPFDESAGSSPAYPEYPVHYKTSDEFVARPPLSTANRQIKRPVERAKAAPPRRSRADNFELFAPTQSVKEASVTPRLVVAALADRRRAALLDGAILLFSYGGMLGLFWALGGHIDLNRLDAIVVASTLFLFYTQYFALFTVFGGSTPGMMFSGLRVVSADGEMPTSRQMMWRSAGYLATAATGFVALLWPIFDRQNLGVQDRLSGTYVASNEGVGARAGS